jgi:CRISPR-associated protein Csm2
MEKYPNQHFEAAWVQSNITPEIIEWTKSFGEFLCKKNNNDYVKPLSTSQLRKFFGELRRIDTDVDKKIIDLPMLRPMLAYAVGRDKDDKGKNKTRIKELSEELSKGLDGIRQDTNQKKDFKNFINILESIVAYHKYYGGK